jgi:glycosyltransferase involved in cell wall biosynthesis
MKLLMVNTLYAPRVVGGAERSVQVLAEEFVRQGHEVSVLCCGPGPSESRELNGVRVHEVGLENLYWPFEQAGSQGRAKALWHARDTYNRAMARAARALIGRERPDLVHTNNLAGFSVALWGAVKSLGLPILHTLRDHYLLCPRTTMFRRDRACARPCLDCRVYALPRHHSSSMVDGVVGNSKYLLERHLAHGYFRRARLTQVIANGFERRGPLPERTGTPPPLRLGYLGRLSDQKGTAYVLRLLRDRFADRVEIHLAGRGTPDYEAMLRALWPAPQVRFLGFADPATLFAQTDVLLMPALAPEALPRAVFEAYSYGIPVIGSQRGGTPELVEEGRTGFIFEPNAPESFARALERFLADPSLAAAMRPACLEKAREFTPVRIAAQYLGVYRSLSA